MICQQQLYEEAAATTTTTLTVTTKVQLNKLMSRLESVNDFHLYDRN